MTINNYPELSEIQRKRKKQHRLNAAPIGLLAGLLFPMLALVFLYFFFFSSWNFDTYLKMFVNFKLSVDMNNASKMVSLAMIANLIPFYYFLNRKYYYTTKGVLIASFMLVVLILLYKFAWQ